LRRLVKRNALASAANTCKGNEPRKNQPTRAAPIVARPADKVKLEGLKMSKTLFLERRGCDFFPGDKITTLSDVGNYRVGVYDFSVVAKDGRKFVLEFGGVDKYTFRRISKRTGKPLKKPAKELVRENALHISTQYDTPSENGKFMLSFADLEIERKIYEMQLSYTLSGILEAVNAISAEQYTDVVVVRDADIGKGA
jgi:hypothetical protein